MNKKGFQRDAPLLFLEKLGKHGTFEMEGFRLDNSLVSREVQRRCGLKKTHGFSASGALVVPINRTDSEKVSYCLPVG